ncbi:hypothetical protein LCGC14_2419590 [marine sediment metagenome]|uniref:Uncharacterized protein n=1 Tax=marine sediment metagenome TaxID=412755 RepID=A0A0F9EJF3_9ZZZZ
MDKLKWIILILIILIGGMVFSMVLEIPNKLFGQEDVRETATESSAVTGTLYWSCSGTHFIVGIPSLDSMHYNPTGGDFFADQVAIFAYASVLLPHGVVVTGAIVYGSDATNTWSMSRRLISDPTSTGAVASANVNTEDTSISNATIDNSTYVYVILTNIGTNDRIEGARVTYTL